MRPYRAKRIDNGEWVKGWYVKINSRHYICNEIYAPLGIFYYDKPNGERINLISNLLGGLIEVDPETVGQQTGLKDKNDKGEVYKGDIIDFFGLRQYIVEWNEKTGQWVGHVVGNKNIQKPLWEILKIFRTVAKGHIGEGLYYQYPKVIGNIHSNPELMSGDKK